MIAVLEEITKVCSKCEKEKSITDFSKNKPRKGGLQCWCKQCLTEYQQIHKIESNKSKKKYQQTHKVEKAKYMKMYRQSIEGYLRARFTSIEYRCSNPKEPNYKNYGGRRIKNLFASFSDFFDYVTINLGFDCYEKIKGLHIHRINNNGHYEHGNIEFLTIFEHRAKHIEIERLYY